MGHRLSLANIEGALRIIDPVFLDTPQHHVESLDAVLGCRLIAKIETVNPVRSFKGRGASFFLANVPVGSELICASAGNFGQAMGYACRSRGVRLVVYASENASPLKVESMRGLGAEVRLHGADFDAAKIEAKRVAATEGIRLVEDSLEPATGEGAGTIAIELLRWPEQLDAVLLALGNGALLTGVGRWVKANAHHTAVIGVGADGAPAMVDSWRAGTIIEHATTDTIADGIAVRVPIPEVLEDMHGTVDDAVSVADATIVQAMRLLHRHMGLVVEPSGAVGVAAILEDPARFQGQTVATVLCGGNLTPEQARDWLL